jgi:transcriptional regulator with XRE-family HTH domain
MPHDQESLFAAVDALLEEAVGALPPPAERVRLREAASLTQAQVGKALSVRRETVADWEAGRKEPRPPKRAAYIRLLAGLAARYPAPNPQAPPQTLVPAPASEKPGATPASASTTTAPLHPATVNTRPSPTPRPARKTTAPDPAPPADPRFPHGPLGILDGDGAVYCTGGLVLETPAETVPQLVEWTLAEAGLGAPRLHRHGQDTDPLIVVTAAAAARLGLPPRLEDRRGLRLPEDHPAVREVLASNWQLTKRGFGPWTRIYRPVRDGGRRQCVQLAILPWDALDTRAWGAAAELPAPELARALGTYATRVLTPRGSTAVCGLELMTSLRPPTRAARDTGGGYVSAPNPGALTRPVDPAPPEAPAEHPVAQGWERGFLDEEAYQWVRDPKLLSDAECLLPYAVGLDINTAFLAAAARLPVGLGEPTHVRTPVFDKKVPGSWLVDLSHIDLDPRLPSPFTPSGERPTGPAWYATPTVAYAQELGADVRPIEAFVRRESGAWLDPWHDRLKNAYVATIADLDVPVDKDADQHDFLHAMALHQFLKNSDIDDLHQLRDRLEDNTLLQQIPVLAYYREMGDEELTARLQRHQHTAIVLSAIKSTVKGGIGKLRERPQGRGYRDGQRWPALERPTWRPDIRAAVISKARVNMHRKMAKMAQLTGQYPLGVLSDCVVYPSPGPSPLDLLPRATDGTPLVGTFRLGATPGLAKLEGVQEMAWAVDLMEQGYNPARHIKGGDAVLDGGE